MSRREPADSGSCEVSTRATSEKAPLHPVIRATGWVSFFTDFGSELIYKFYNWDSGSGGDDSDTELGLNLVGGATRGLSGGNELFFEVKFGVADSPDGKLTVGLTFF